MQISKQMNGPKQIFLKVFEAKELERVVITKKDSILRRVS